MKRRAFLGTALAGLPITGAFAAQPKPKAGDIPTTRLGKSGIEVQVIAQGGARMDLHPDIPSAADHVRQVYELGVRYFDCARSYWNGRSEEAYGLGLQGVRNNVFLTSKSVGRTATDAERDLDTSLRLLKTDHLDLWQMHDIRTVEDVQAVMKPGGAMEAFETPGQGGDHPHPPLVVRPGDRVARLEHAQSSGTAARRPSDAVPPHMAGGSRCPHGVID